MHLLHLHIPRGMYCYISMAILEPCDLSYETRCTRYSMSSSKGCLLHQTAVPPRFSKAQSGDKATNAMFQTRLFRLCSCALLPVVQLCSSPWQLVPQHIWHWHIKSHLVLTMWSLHALRPSSLSSFHVYLSYKKCLTIKIWTLASLIHFLLCISHL